MKIILKKPWGYTFFNQDGQIYLSVVCGGVGIFKIKIQLTDDENLMYKEEGTSYVDKLAKQIQLNP